ncbi:MAG TPA: COX15/CtaA family protein [Dehalococcoidia bacterium]|nr:COX15/CtaA family protein [Dehalococcoidia bacterium]
MTWFQRLLLITLLATFVLVIVGGTVRATDSGLGCPDWPTCHGSLIPKAEKHTLIEWSHRTVAAVVGFLFLGVTYAAFRDERRHTREFWIAFAAGVVLVVQIALGAITVERELPAEITAAHLGTAMIFMGLMIVAFMLSRFRSRAMSVFGGAADSPFSRMAVVAAVAAFATLVLGSYISGTDASLACDGWPLCNGSVVPDGGQHVGLHYLHRVLAGILGVLMLGLIYLGFEERRNQPWLLVLPAFGGVAYVAQALIGAANIWTELAAWVVVTHLSLAALLWCTLVVVSVLSLYLPGEQAVAAEGEASRRRKAAEWA